MGAAVLAVYSLRTNRINPLTSPIGQIENSSRLQTPPKQAPAPPVEEKKQSLPKTPTTAVLSVVLIPDLVRGNGEQPQLTLSPGNHIVQLRMERDSEPYSRYEATVSTPERQTIAHRANLEPVRSARNIIVVLTLSSALLGPGVYILNLKGQSTSGQLDDLDDYTFQVSNR